MLAIHGRKNTTIIFSVLILLSSNSFKNWVLSHDRYDLNRFAGDASVVGNAELLMSIGRFNSVLPFRYGVTGLADVGRVFVANESSSKWHAGYGGGIWLGVFALGSTFQFASALKATLLHSDEGTSFYLLSGFSL